jgi:RHS repeat-associated protein
LDTTFEYDSYGRPANSFLTLDPTTNNYFYTETDYDAWSRPITQIYQRGVASADPPKIYDLRYNAYGYLQSVQRAGLTLWQSTSQDAANRVVTARLATAGGSSDGVVSTHCYNAYSGRLTSAVVAPPANAVPCTSTPAIDTFQEGYAYDGIGNVQTRTQSWNQGIAGTVTSQTFNEAFTYDGLNRVYTSQVTSQVPGSPQAVQQYGYDGDGRLLTKTGVGSYIYTGGTSGGPHAVKSITGTPGVPGSFSYDVDGNQVGGDGRANTWTSFDMPLVLGSGSNTSQFNYGPNHERRVQKQSSGATICYGGAQEVQMSAGVIVSVKTYWPHGLGVEIDRPTQNGSELDWTHADNLGSVVAITDVVGNLKEALEYDAWGSRRNTSGAPVAINTTQVTENADDTGYTGQEMIDSLALVHLNGRVYDPLLGKLLSGDPFVGDPSNGQNYNRYAYVLNNPTNHTDVTGFLCWVCIRSSLWTQSPELLPDEGELKGAQNDVIIRPDGSSGPQKNESTGQALTTQQENRLATCEAAGGNCEQFRNPLSPEKFQNGINETRKQMSDAGADVAREVGIWILLSDFKPFKLAGKWLDSMFGKSAPEIAAKEMTTVGRWMSKEEYALMKETGKVQESLSGTTHVANPADASAFMNQAKPGSVYVEFQVPTSSLKATNEGWAKIVGPNSLEGRLAARKGLEIPQMPEVTDIVHSATKLP